MITHPLAAKLFEGFSILRWNDRLRPMEFIETDHHGYKSMLTYFLGSLAGGLDSADWRRIVDGCVFDFLKKISTSDIHSKVRARIKHEPSFNQFIISDWRNKRLELSYDFLIDFEEYLKSSPSGILGSILRFSHRYSSLSELEVISRFCNDADIEAMISDIKSNLAQNTHDAFSSEANALLASDNDYWLTKIMSIANRLRYQMRWGQTPRIPMTSVLGHSMYTAVLTYFTSIKAGLDDARVVNNFYAALFHDLPEALSRDIISPIKRMSKEVETLIKGIEEEMFESDILSLIPANLQTNFRFLTGAIPGVHEFDNRVMIDGAVQVVPWGKDKEDEEFPFFGIMEHLNDYREPMKSHLNACGSTTLVRGIDGKLIKICDHLSAFMEADMSILHGIKSPALKTGRTQIKSTCKKMQTYNLNVEDFFEKVKPYDYFG